MISDKQWDNAYELSIVNPKEAIKEYKLALETSGHPFLYTNIASAYYELGDMKSSAEWYKKSESLLLSLEDKYSPNPYANYAYFLYKKKDYKKALVFSEIAMEIDSEIVLFMENHVRILLALKDKEKAIPFLVRLRLIVPDWESIQDLLTENKKEIDDYYEKTWELKDKRFVLEEIIKLHDLDKEKLFKYLDSKKGAAPAVAYDKWDSIFKDMLSAGIEITDPFFTKLFKVLIKKEDYLKLFNFLHGMIENTKTGYLLVLNLMKAANLKKKLVIQQLLRNVNKDNEAELIEAFSEDLIPSYKKELKTWIKELNNPIARVVIIQTMQNTAPEFFKEEIKAYLEKNIDSKRFNQILSKLDDEKLKEKLYNQKLEKWFSTMEILKDNPLFQELVYKYIRSTSKKPKAPIAILAEFKNIVKYDNYFDFWENFVYNFPAEDNEIMYEKSFRLSLIFDPHTAMLKHISFTNDLKTTMALLAKNSIPLTFYLKYLIKEIHKQEDKGELIVEFINKNLKEVLESFELISIKEKTAILPVMWEYQKARLTPFLFNLTNTNSKTIQAAIKEILKKEDHLINDVIELLQARKASTRAIAVDVLLARKDDTIKALLKEHLVMEKSEPIRKVIKKVVGEFSN